MFKNLKLKIKELARKAVLLQNHNLAPGSKGQEKKKLAIDYIVKKSSITNFCRRL